MLQAFGLARHIAVFETDPDARVDREPAWIPREQLGGGLGVEEAVSLVPPDESATDSFGERLEVGRSDRASGDELDGVVIDGRVVSHARHEHAVGDAHMKMDVVVEGCTRSGGGT